MRKENPRLGTAVICGAFLVVAVACGSGAQSASNPTAPGGDPAPADPKMPVSETASPAASPPGSPAASPPTSDSGVASELGDAATDASLSNGPVDVAAASCAVPLPAGTPRAAALPVYAGTCPVLAAPPALTTIATSGAQRSFLVFRPASIAPGETLPVVFLWQWLGGSPDGVASRFEVQNAVDARRFIGVIPAPKGDVLFRWPFEASQPQSRVDEEARFFDDMLACVGAALPANKECVSSVGVSAGALWTAQLATVRSERLASMVSLSGGVGGGIVRGWTPPPHHLPALVLWGGPSDTYPAQAPIMNFQNASKNLLGALAADGHFIVECTHNCGHAIPPFDAPAPGSGALFMDPVWRFVLDHPFWLPPSASPYVSKPLAAPFPSWCGKGVGSATPRPSGAACQP